MVPPQDDEAEELHERTYFDKPTSGTAHTASRVRLPVESVSVGQTLEGATGSRYEVLQELGRGGMAEVYRARRTNPQGFVMDVALKSFLDVSFEGEVTRRAFLHEVEVSRHLRHPGIAVAYDLEQLGGKPYLVLEFVDGVSLSAVMREAARRQVPIPLSFLCYVAACVADALHHAHSRTSPTGEPLGIIHRDLSPGNVMVTHDGVPKLLDFGVAYARLDDRDRTKAGMVRGTYAYLSPEQAAAGRADDGQLDGRSDLFSLGQLFVKLATGEQVFQEEDDYLICRATAECSAARVRHATQGLPPGLQQVVRRALSKDPRDRHQTGEELAVALREELARLHPLYGARECARDLAALGAERPGHGEAALSTQRGSMLRSPRARRWALALGALLTTAGAVGGAARLVTARTSSAQGAASVSRSMVDGSRESGDAAPLPASTTGPFTASLQGSAENATGSLATVQASTSTTYEPLRSPVPSYQAPGTLRPQEGGASEVSSFNWPGGVPIRPKVAAARREVKPAKASKPAGSRGEVEVAPPKPVEEEVHRATSPASHGALLQFADRETVEDASFTLPRGTVMRAQLAGRLNAAKDESASAVLTEDVVGSQGVLVPRGSELACRVGSSASERVRLVCESASSGGKTWRFSALAVGDGARAGLPLVDGVVPSGTRFLLSVTASAVLE